MIGEIIGSLIGAGSQIATNAFNLDMMRENNQFQAEQAKINADREYAYNQKLYKQQNEYNLDMWNKQNAYNSPQAQMERLAAAGLNPNLAYGSLSEGNAGAVQTANMPAYQIDQAHTQAFQAVNPLGGLIQMLSSIKDLEMKDAQINNVNADTSNKGLQGTILGYEGDIKKMDSETYKDYRALTLESLRSSIDNVRSQIDFRKVEKTALSIRSSLEANKNRVEKVRADMAELGLNYDNPWELVLFKIADNFAGGDVTGGLKSLMKLAGEGIKEKVGFFNNSH